MFDLTELEAARDLVHAAMSPTPQIAWPLLAERAGCKVWVKHENHSPIGAFKVRGGLTWMDWRMRQDPPPAGIVSATRGNHGQSLAFAARRVGVPLVICVPEGNSVEKNAAMRAFGAELVEAGRDFEAARQKAQEIATERGLEMVPSFHPQLVRGVATYALELFRGAGELDAVYCPIGLGSGLCGIIRTRDLLGLKTEVIGVVAEGAPAYALSYGAGEVVPTESSNTLADGMATRIPDPDAFAMIRDGVARIVTVSDTEIVAAMQAYYSDTHNLAEGAGAAALAALLQEGEQQAGRKVGVILSGGNIDRSLYLKLMAA
ncbi:threonine dehydratase [Aquibaculum arenosum]|uniref:Threonine dehydratase n=1 Tax=Aquibaculum arenosum TaxID=3032591 RepID=A0ABT5YRQ6_9PROT|nr:threonine dehydratase [Fodinicurvata sp. CAU 1616]MDF2096894.1 threonine dehydratase [Fodinicurvata sp. CAU 1616]